MPSPTCIETIHGTVRCLKPNLRIKASPLNIIYILCVPSMAQLLSSRENSLIIQRVQVPDVRILKAHSKLQAGSSLCME